MDEGNTLLASALILDTYFLLARATLARLHANGDINDSFVTSQMEDIKVNLDKSRDIGESRYDHAERICAFRDLIRDSLILVGWNFSPFPATSVVLA
jgi:hypothetical protein